VAGVAGCIALTAYALSANPTCTARSASCAPATATAPALPWATAAFLAIVLAGCLGVALAPPRALTPVRLARPVAVGAALMLGAGVLLEAHLSDEGVLASFFLAPLVVIFVASLAVTVATRSFRAGVQTSTWVCLLGVLAVFAVGLLEALRRFRVDGALILDAEPAAAFGDNLVSLTFMLFVLPLWWLPFGVFGAAFGREMVSSAAPGRSGRGSCAPAP
jgi:hypothetical protein